MAVFTYRVRIQGCRTPEGKCTFVAAFPLQCRVCGYNFRRRVQVGVNHPTIFCPLCYSRSALRLQWHIREDAVTDSAIARVTLQQ